MAFWSALAQSDQENTCTMSHSESALESATNAEGGGETSTTETSKTAASDDASTLPISQDTTGHSSDTCRLLTREELIQHLLSISPVPQGQVTTVGMVKKCLQCFDTLVTLHNACTCMCRWVTRMLVRVRPSMLCFKGRRCLSQQLLEGLSISK